MILSEFKKIKLPDQSGVYFFKKRKEIIYIGKATSIKERTKSYFSKDLIKTRGPAILDMVTQADRIEFETTESTIEALILESSLIKKYQPKYNVKEKDDKSYSLLAITNDEFPKVFVIRQRELIKGQKTNIKKIFGPFPSGAQFQIALKIIRKIFPYFDEKKPSKLNIELGLIPDPETVSMNKYRQNIKNIELFFSGKKRKIISDLKKQMNLHAKNLDFEKAAEIKSKIFSLEHLNDVLLIDSGLYTNDTVQKNIHIESFDISHFVGRDNVGVMVTMINGNLEKKLYRKFKIKKAKTGDDLASLAEVLERRYLHAEWKFPDLIVIDGGKTQLSTAKKVLKDLKLNIPIASVKKDNKHNPVEVLNLNKSLEVIKDDIIRVNNETHRFAIAFNRKSRKLSRL